MSRHVITKQKCQPCDAIWGKVIRIRYISLNQGGGLDDRHCCPSSVAEKVGIGKEGGRGMKENGDFHRAIKCYKPLGWPLNWSLLVVTLLPTNESDELKNVKLSKFRFYVAVPKVQPDPFTLLFSIISLHKNLINKREGPKCKE